MSSFKLYFLLPYSNQWDLKRNHGLVSFTVGDDLSHPDVDCKILDKWENFGDIYVQFKELDSEKIFSEFISFPRSSKLEKKQLVIEICSFLSGKKINLSSKEFMVNTNLFIFPEIYKTGYRDKNYPVYNYLEKMNSLHYNQLQSLIGVLHDKYSSEQPSSYYIRMGTDEDKIRNEYSKIGSYNKIHISIDPSYINKALPLLIKYMSENVRYFSSEENQQYSSDRIIKKFPNIKPFVHEIIKRIQRDLLLSGVLKMDSSNSMVRAKQPQEVRDSSPEKWPELSKAWFKEVSKEFLHIFPTVKIQLINPSHLYKEIDSEWKSKWDNITDIMPTGLGYIVIYPLDRFNNSFKDDLNIFKDYWITEFENEYPDAKRDRNYLTFNERVSETIYIAAGSDTSSRMNAQKKSDKLDEIWGIRYKTSNKIKDYIDKYCDERTHPSVKGSLKNCLNRKFNLLHDRDYICPYREEKDGIWIKPEVWLLNSSDDNDIVNCEIPEIDDLGEFEPEREEIVDFEPEREKTKSTSEIDSVKEEIEKLKKELGLMGGKKKSKRKMRKKSKKKTKRKTRSKK